MKKINGIVAQNCEVYKGGFKLSDIQFWRYSLPSVDGIEGWGIFLLDSTGMFSCVTDYGNYAFKWTHHGMSDFREFFVSDSFDYYIKKLYLNNGGQLEFQSEETIENIKKNIIHSRLNDYMSEETARREWDLLDSIDWDMGEIAKHDWYIQTDLCDAHEYFIYDYPANVKALRDNLLPRFSKLIRNELEKEKASA